LALASPVSVKIFSASMPASAGNARVAPAELSTADRRFEPFADVQAHRRGRR
jgi:hypothetical protein